MNEAIMSLRSFKEFNGAGLHSCTCLQSPHNYTRTLISLATIAQSELTVSLRCQHFLRSGLSLSSLHGVGVVNVQRLSNDGSKISVYCESNVKEKDCHTTTQQTRSSRV